MTITKRRHADNRVSGAAHKQAMREQLWIGIGLGVMIGMYLAMGIIMAAHR